jgi:hypothetical protein
MFQGSGELAKTIVPELSQGAAFTTA